MRRIALAVLLVSCDRVFDLQLLATPDAPPPDAAQDCLVQDEFDAGVIGSQWETDFPASSIAVTETAGDLVISPQSFIQGYNGIHAIATRDLTGTTVHVELKQVLNAGPGDIHFVVDLDHTVDDNYYMIFTSDGYIGFRAKHGTTDEDGTSYSPTGDRFWRMRFDPQRVMMTFETSADDVIWNVRKTVAITVPIQAMHVALVAGTYNGGYANPGQAHFDHFSVCPTP